MLHKCQKCKKFINLKFSLLNFDKIMNLYTICNKNESIIDLSSTDCVNFQNYSMNEYNKFIEIAKKHYISRVFSWY